MYYSTFQKGTKVLQEDGQADQAWMDLEHSNTSRIQLHSD